MSNPFQCALDPYKPGGEIAKRQEKLEQAAKQLGIKWGKWTEEEYFILCDLAGVSAHTP